MKRGRVVLVLSILFLSSSFLPILRFLPSRSRDTGNYDLSLGNVDDPTYYLSYGTSVVLDVSISGANRDVFFYITDSDGKRFLDAGRIYDGYKLEWQCRTHGENLHEQNGSLNNQRYATSKRN